MPVVTSSDEIMSRHRLIYRVFLLLVAPSASVKSVLKFLPATVRELQPTGEVGNLIILICNNPASHPVSRNRIQGSQPYSQRHSRHFAPKAPSDGIFYFPKEKAHRPIIILGRSAMQAEIAFIHTGHRFEKFSLPSGV